MEVQCQLEMVINLHKRQSRLNLKPGDTYREKNRKAIVEGVAVGGMNALVYYGASDFRVVGNRPIFYTSNDLIVKVSMVHRCGTDVRYYHEGNKFIDCILLSELRDLTNLSGSFNPTNLREYVDFLQTGEVRRQVEDEFYVNLTEHWGILTQEKGIHVTSGFFREWGRVPGHEMVGTIERIGSNVKRLTKPLGYTSTWLRRLSTEYLDFKEGERVILQTRCARYRDPPKFLQEGNVGGIQLLGMDIEDGARSLDGGFAQYVRITPEMIRSGCVIRVPYGISDTEAALVEPTACLVDCLDLSVHPEGQSESGNILKKGVRRDGVSVIIGSGAMAFIAAEVALTMDERVQVGGASKVVMFVRSEDKVALAKRILSGRFTDKIDFFIYDSNLSHEENAKRFKKKYGRLSVVDDVVIAAGDAKAVELAHRIVSGTGCRIHAFAGTRGNITVESGIWHYGNAGTQGTSGCNTRSMENVLRMIERGTLELAKFSGNEYCFKDIEKDPSIFFKDKYLRPALLPNERLSEVEWRQK